MARAPGKTYTTDDLARAAADAASVGNTDLACALLTDALKLDRRDCDLYVSRAAANRMAGRTDAAVADLCLALAVKPTDARAARQLSNMAASFVIEQPGDIDPAGLMAAFSHDRVALQPIAALAFAQVFAKDRDLKAAAGAAPDELVGRAQSLIRPRLASGLASDLFHAALAHGLAMDQAIERVLTQVRRGILELGPTELLARPEVFKLAIALLAQVWRNDLAWHETPAETSTHTELAIDTGKLLAGEPKAGATLLLWLLYRPLTSLEIPGLDQSSAARIRPKLLGAALAARLALEAEDAQTAAGIPQLAPLTDATSLRVAAQYAAAPYPRWTSLQAPERGSLLRALGRYRQPNTLAVQDQPFDVLIAGAGTGQQAIRSTLGYGDKARVVAIDLSKPSLAYGRRMARRYGVSNLSFEAGDLLDLGRTEQQFDIIESIGVLHHMADPLMGWQVLVSKLKPGGAMYVGLYSKTARQEIALLRNEPGYPGAGCSDAAARSYRRQLLDRTDGEIGATLKQSRNFYALSEFRDLVLHESEQHFAIAEIEQFLAANGLAFLGFTLPDSVLQRFTSVFPASIWPGRLDDWARFETDNPRTFEGMYCFWCGRT